MISPGEFIPVFEKNGFIGKLDLFMWERTCFFLKKWRDEGLLPAPVSVNISRVNMYNPNLVDTLKELVNRYGLPTELLNLELTESAYMDNPELMKKQVENLRRAGFLILMDDFGSGYSSLNTLKEVPVDILKIDMRFLPTGPGDSRSERILAAIIRMAGQLGLVVIVEGVETAEQVAFLESIGCGYVQGFYFARPMPASEYESLLRQPGLEAALLPVSTVTESELEKTIWSSDAVLENLFNCIPSPAAIFEYNGTLYDPIRVNTAFQQELGSLPLAMPTHNPSSLTSEALANLRSVFERIAHEKGCLQTDFPLHDPSGEKWWRLRLQYMQQRAKSVLLFGIFSDVTHEKGLEARANPQIASV